MTPVTGSLNRKLVDVATGIAIFVKAALFSVPHVSESEPMVKGADKPETIHGEPHQREDTGKSYVASTQRRAGSYAEYPIFKTT
jgi:hypothetical protein